MNHRTPLHHQFDAIRRVLTSRVLSISTSVFSASNTLTFISSEVIFDCASVLMSSSSSSMFPCTRKIDLYVSGCLPFTHWTGLTSVKFGCHKKTVTFCRSITWNNKFQDPPPKLICVKVQNFESCYKWKTTYLLALAQQFSISQRVEKQYLCIG